MPQLVLLRHGQSQWNADNLFTGWYDVDLTEQGESEARRSGRLLADEAELDLRVLHTSLLTRAIRTADLALEVAGRSWLPVRRHWRLNERHYGALQGLNKKETTARFGEAQVKAWRRSYDTPPPPVEPGQRAPPRRRPPLPGRPGRRSADHRVPGRRGRPVYCPTGRTPSCPTCWPKDSRGGAVLVVAHGNSLRALRKHIDGHGRRGDRRPRDPHRHSRSSTTRRRPVVVSEGYLGDPAAARAAAEAVSRQAG